VRHELRSDVYRQSRFTGSGGESIATFLLGIPDGGDITTASITLTIAVNLRGLCPRRHQSESAAHPNPVSATNSSLPSKRANDQAATFDFNCPLVIVPRTEPATNPTLGTGTQRSAQRIAGAHQFRSQTIAPRIGLAYQLTISSSSAALRHRSMADRKRSILQPSPALISVFDSQNFSTPCSGLLQIPRPHCSISAANSGSV